MLLSFFILFLFLTSIIIVAVILILIQSLSEVVIDINTIMYIGYFGEFHGTLLKFNFMGNDEFLLVQLAWWSPITYIHVILEQLLLEENNFITRIITLFLCRNRGVICAVIANGSFHSNFITQTSFFVIFLYSFFIEFAEVVSVHLQWQHFSSF